MLRSFSARRRCLKVCMMASQHVWVPVTHWPCFLLGHSAAVWGPTAEKLQSEHSLTPSHTLLHTDTHTLRVFHTRDNRLGYSMAPYACTLRSVAYAWVLSLVVSAYYFTVYEPTKNKFPWLLPTISLQHGSRTPLRAAGWCMRCITSCHLARALKGCASVCDKLEVRGWVAG